MYRSREEGAQTPREFYSQIDHPGSAYPARLKEPLFIPAGRERIGIERRPALACGVLLRRLSVA